MTLLYFSALLVLTLASVLYRYIRRRPTDTVGAIALNLLAGAGLYVLLGPALGAITVSVAMTAVSMSPEGLQFMLYGLPWAYIYGIVPALFCGITAGALKPSVSSWRACRRLGAVGGLYGFLFMMGFTSKDGTWNELVFPVFMGALPAAFSATLCARLLYGKTTTAIPLHLANP